MKSLTIVRHAKSSWKDRGLSDRERDILARRFGLNLAEPETLQMISDQLGISRERVRQIEKSALKKLQQQFSAESTSP